MSDADLFFGGADRGRTKAVGSPERASFDSPGCHPGFSPREAIVALKGRDPRRLSTLRVRLNRACLDGEADGMLGDDHNDPLDPIHAQDGWGPKNARHQEARRPRPSNSTTEDNALLSAPLSPALETALFFSACFSRRISTPKGCRPSPVGTVEFSRGRKPTGRGCERAVSRVAATECGERFMSPLRGLPILPHGHRGVVPTAEPSFRYAAVLPRCVEQRPCGPGLMNHVASRLRPPSAVPSFPTSRTFSKAGGNGPGFLANDLLGNWLGAALVESNERLAA
jgi:hypothetical protein